MGKGGVFVLRNLMRRAVRVIWILTVVLILAIIPWMITSLANDGYSPHEIGYNVAGVFTLGACLLSIWLMAMHLDNFNAPKLQTPIIRIVLMVPIYALNGWIALVFNDLAIYLDTFRKIYEAFVLNQFFVYLTTYLGGDPETSSFLPIENKLRKRETPQPHIFPLCWLTEWPEDKFVDGCRFGINLYVFCRVSTGLVELVLYPFGLYHPGSFGVNEPYLYFTLLNNFAACWAIYCLVIFYFALEKEMRAVNPLYKFLCIKAVVFFAWWQSVILAIAEGLGLIADHMAWTSENPGEIAASIQNFCICIEMLFVALVHTWAFSYKEFRAPAKPGDDSDDRDSLFNRAVSMFDFRDIGQDVMHSTRNPVMPEVDRSSLAPLLARVRGKSTTNVDGDQLPPIQESEGPASD